MVLELLGQWVTLVHGHILSSPSVIGLTNETRPV